MMKFSPKSDNSDTPCHTFCAILAQKGAIMNQNELSDTLTVIREMDDGYVVRLAYTESNSLGRTERTDFITRKLFESCVRTGYLKRIAKGEKK